MITSDKQIIDNLSRIKVLPKNNFNNNNIDCIENIDVLSICSTEESLKSIPSLGSSQNKSFNLIDLNSKSVNASNTIKTNFCEINNFNTDNKEVICVEPKPNHNYNYDNHCIKRVGNTLSNETTVNSFEPQLVANSICSNSKETAIHSQEITNCFGPKILKSGLNNNSYELYYETTVEKIGNNSYITLKLSSVFIKEFKLLLQIMTPNIYLFEIKSSNSLEPNSFWIIVSNEMISKGCTKWKPQKCRDTYFCSINLYKKV